MYPNNSILPQNIHQLLSFFSLSPLATSATGREVRMGKEHLFGASGLLRLEAHEPQDACEVPME